MNPNGLAFEVRDIGPVVELRGELTPGLNVVRGPQGAGKTTTLRTLQLIADGRTDIKPTKRDQTKAGVASLAGKTVTITRQTRYEGELLNAEGLGDLDLGLAPGRLVVLPQAAFGELADSSRSIIDRVARERGACVLTAQADDGALRIETWSDRPALVEAAVS